MRLHHRAVERDADGTLGVQLLELLFQFLPLQPGEDALHHARADPAPPAYVN